MSNTIYIYAEQIGREDWRCFALAEDGTGLAGHLSSNEYWARHDMGFDGSTKKHNHYAEHYPDGYELEWVTDPETHFGYMAALALNRARTEEAKP